MSDRDVTEQCAPATAVVVGSRWEHTGSGNAPGYRGRVIEVVALVGEHAKCRTVHWPYDGWFDHRPFRQLIRTLLRDYMPVPSATAAVPNRDVIDEQGHPPRSPASVGNIHYW